jgi:predicted NUDIX family phosphoesterase
MELFDELDEKEELGLLNGFEPLVTGGHFTKRQDVYQICLREKIYTSLIAELLSLPVNAVRQTLLVLKEKNLVKRWNRVPDGNKEDRRITSYNHSSLKPFRPLMRYVIKNGVKLNRIEECKNISEKDLKRIEKLFFKMLDSEIGRMFVFLLYVKKIEEAQKTSSTVRGERKLPSKKLGGVEKLYQDAFSKRNRFLRRMCYYLEHAYESLFFNPFQELTQHVFFTTHATYREANVKRSYFDLYIPENAPKTFEKRIENMKCEEEYKNEVKRIMGLPKNTEFVVVREGEISKRAKERLYDYYKLLLQNQVLEKRGVESFEELGKEYVSHPLNDESGKREVQLREIKLFSNNMYEILKIIKKYWNYSDEWYSWMKYIQ